MKMILAMLILAAGVAAAGDLDVKDKTAKQDFDTQRTVSASTNAYTLAQFQYDVQAANNVAKLQTALLKWIGNEQALASEKDKAKKKAKDDVKDVGKSK